MSAIFCPNCGKKHTINNKFCEYCGNNLGEAILRYKQKHLPIKYQQSSTPKPYLQAPTKGIEKRPRKKVVYITTILLLIFLTLAIATISIASYLRITDPWIFIMAGVFGILFIISLAVRSSFRPRRRGGSCSGGSGCDCGGSDCSGCDCSGCDCGGFDC